MTLPTPHSLRLHIRRRLIAASTNRDVTASIIIRRLVIRIRSVAPSTKDVSEGGRERILGMKLTLLAHFEYKDLLSTALSFFFLTES